MVDDPSQPDAKAQPELTHVDPQGRVRMVDVGDKATTQREAVAEAFVRISPALAQAIQAGEVKKGNVLEVARIAGIQAGKRTAELIPLCHTIPLSQVNVTAAIEAGRVQLRATARTRGQTGVEMEALTAVTVAALTIIDMGKAIDRHMVIDGVRVLAKTGGRHDFLESDTGEPPTPAASTAGSESGPKSTG